jgi:tRNA A-37 threonylcarbamoyl transferase component Bud32
MPSHDPPLDPEATHLSDAPASRLRIGGYLIERPIASGANGIVYRALDERLGRVVALKVLKDEAFPQARERFLREVRMIAGLQHPNVVMLYGAGEDQGMAWAAMELLPASLAHELRQTPRFSADAIRSIARDVCRGLDAAWQKGIVHRDIKPSNLLRSESGAVKVADFGLAKDLSIELNLTAADVVLGTPWYVSPEQASGKAAGVVSDLYSLGATLYHFAAGRVPFESSNALDVIVRHAIEPVPPLPHDVPDSLSRLIYRLLEKDPSKRPADYATVLAALDDDAIDAALEPVLPASVDRGPVDSMSASSLAAARAALQMGRARRVLSLAEPMLKERGAAWVQAGFLVAAAHEENGALPEARSALEAIAAGATINEDRALALWNLGRLCEKESAAALDRAIDTYARIGALSTSRFPKTLLEARIARLRRRSDERKSSMEGSS